jgi:thiosulfate/3-mercaptopyruvate sulfurtransferase
MTTFTTFISTIDLADHLDDLRWVVCDCSFDLTKPEWGRENFLSGHIPGALYAHLDEDLSSPRLPHTGRHPLPDSAAMAARFSSWGIGPSSQVVVYDTVGGGFAARLWWMLRYCGHAAVAILEGGLGQWKKEGRFIVGGPAAARPHAVFTPQIDPAMACDAKQVEDIRHDPAWKLVDARAGMRFRGEQEPIDPVAGHIPGALNRFHGQNLGPDGLLLSKEQLKSDFQTLLGNTPVAKTVVYCGSGVTSCFHIAVMEHIGLGSPRLYPGSWSEWIRDPSRPVATGEK